MGDTHRTRGLNTDAILPTNCGDADRASELHRVAPGALRVASSHIRPTPRLVAGGMDGLLERALQPSPTP
eukprot:853975-Pyramimonas_sp.AAC.1